MAGGLALLRKLIGAAEGSQLTRKIGELFLEGAERPGTFERGRQFADTPEGLEKQFGVRISDPGEDYTGQTVWGLDPGVGRSAELRAGKVYVPEDYHPLTRNPSALYDMDTTAFRRGSGAGKRVYPAMFGMVRNDPDGINVVDVLSTVNQHRRNANQAAAIMRDPNLGRRLLPGDEQMPFAPEGTTYPSRWGRLSPEEQVGLLQGSGALATLRNLELAAAASHRGPNNFLARVPSLLDQQGSDPEQLKLLAEELHTGDTPYIYPEVKSIGEASLRRAAMINDLLQDRPVNMDLFHKLEFKQGGLAALAPRSGAGPGRPEV